MVRAGCAATTCAPAPRPFTLAASQWPDHPGTPRTCHSFTLRACQRQGRRVSSTHHREFLIDTPAIRITPNSFQFIAELHSNRHSSDTRASHQNCKSSLSAGRHTSKSGQARPKLETTGKLPFSHTFSTLFGYAEYQCYPLESAPWRGFS